MPNTKSAEKQLRQSTARNLRNRSVRTALRGQVKKVRQAIAAGDKAASQQEFLVATKKLDQAAAKKVVHKNAVARTKSRLAKQIREITAAAAPVTKKK